MTTQNLFDELKQALTTFKTFLTANVDNFKLVIHALTLMFPEPMKGLITKLIRLMGELKAEINKIDTGTVVGDMKRVTDFATGLTILLTVSKELVPKETDAINEVLAVTKVISSLESFTDVKKDITDLIDAIILDLKKLE